MKTHNFQLPNHLSPEAAALFHDLRESRGITQHHWLLILLQAVELWDRAEDCRRRIETGGALVKDRFEQDKPHPLLIAERQSRQAFARIVASLPISTHRLAQELKGG